MALDEFTNDPSKILLGAVNELINAIGEPSIENENDIFALQEAKEAYNELMRTKTEVLAEGWDCNTDTTELAPDSNGYIQIASNMLDVRDPMQNDYIVRNWYLYSKQRQSIKFEQPVLVEIIWDMIFNQIPYTIRKYIILKALVRFRDRIIGEDATQHSYTEKDVREAYMLARRSESRTSGANMLDTMVEFRTTRY